jgi:hypothetical protein
MAKKNDYSGITDEQYQKASDWLSDGGTKKGACDILRVSNNKTMERLIQEHYDGKANAKRIRAEKRSKAVTDSELVEMVMDYLNGYSLTELSDRYFRSVDIIKHHLYKNGAMLRFHGKINPENPPVMPDQCFAESFEEGQYVWSAKYGCIAQVKAKYKNAYRIQVMGNGRQEQAYQDPAQLGNLEHLEAFGVKLEALEDYMQLVEVQATVAQTMRNANKQAVKDAKG